jgi:hypothetical protein
VTKELTPLRKKDIETGRKLEREAIIQWLRNAAAKDTPFNLDPMSAFGLPLDMAAANIEDGDHLK